MSRSSIFNFESYADFRPRMPWTVLGVLGVMVLLEFGFRSLSQDFIPPPFSRVGIFRWFEREVIPKCERPRVLIMGSSRAADGVTPRFLDEALHLPAGSTLNLGLQGGTGFDGLQFYKRNRGRLSQVQLLLINVDEWFFTSKMGPGYRYGIGAPWNERWRFAHETELIRRQGEEESAWLQRRQEHSENLAQRRTEFLLDGLFYTRLMMHYVPKAVSIWMGKKNRTRVLDENSQVRLAMLEAGPEMISPAVFGGQLQDFYAEFDLHPFMIGHLDQLVQLAQSDGVRVVLMQMPNRRLYQEEVDRLFRPQYDAQREVIQTLAKRHRVPAFCFRFPEECGLEERDFADYGHLAIRGSRTFTAFLAGLIRENHLLPDRRADAIRVTDPPQSGTR